MPSVLFVFTSANKNLCGEQTGWYLPEAAHPYYVLSPHVGIDFASPAGPNPPVDENSVKMYAEDKEAAKFLKDEVVKSKLAKAQKLSEVQVADYDAVFYIGGHGPVMDLASDPVNAKMASEFWQSGKIVSAVCHGPAALVGAVDTNGKSIFSGRSFTGFSNAEEKAVDGDKKIPFNLEDKITELGGKFEKADALWDPKVVVDGRLITGQNPNSAGAIGEAILKAVQ